MTQPSTLLRLRCALLRAKARTHRLLRAWKAAQVEQVRLQLQWIRQGEVEARISRRLFDLTGKVPR